MLARAASIDRCTGSVKGQGGIIFLPGRVQVHLGVQRPLGQPLSQNAEGTVAEEGLARVAPV